MMAKNGHVHGIKQRVGAPAAYRVLDELSSKAGLLVLFFFFLVSVAIYFRPLIYGDSLYFRDFQIFFAPMKHFLGNAFSDGFWPWWNSAVQMGSPFFADPQSGVFYPPSIVFVFLDTPRAMAVSLVFHLVLGQFGVYQMSRHNGFSRIPAVAAALVYGLGGWSLSSANMLTLAHSVAWAPWTLLVCERLWSSPNLRNIVIATLVLAMQMYSGWPEMFILLAITLLVRRILIPGVMNWRWLLASLGSGLLAAGLFMPQFLATLEAFQASVRVGGLSADQLLESSAIWEQWRSLLWPPAINTDNWDILAVFPGGHVPIFLSLHFGWMALLLAAIALIDTSKSSLGWVVIAAIGVFLALGDRNPLAVPVLNLFNPFRTPEKYLFLFHIGIAMLVAPGVERLLRWLPMNRGSHLTGVVLILLLAAELIYAGRKIDLVASPSYYDFSLNDEVHLINIKPGRVYTRSVAQQDINSVRELYSAYRDTFSSNIGVMAGLGYVDGVTFLPFREHRLVNGLINQLPAGEMLARRLAFFGVHYLITDDPAFAHSEGWKANARQLSPKLWQLNVATPLISFAEQVVHGRDQDLPFAATDPDFARGALAYVNPQHAVTGNKNLGEITLLESRSGRYQLEVETSGSSWLVLRENYYPGWSATIDGEPVDIIPTNRVFMGISIPPGTHRITFEFSPSQLKLGLIIAALSSVILLVFSLWHWLDKDISEKRSFKVNVN